MVTDEEHKKLIERVDVLERRVINLASFINTLIMKSDSGHMRIAEEEKPTRDKTKYIFLGERFNKRRLALACVITYVTDHNIQSGSALLQVFPNDIQGPLGVVREIANAELYSDAVKRFFFSDEHVLHFQDGDYVICREWHNKNIENLIKVMESYGYSVTKVEGGYYAQNQ